MSPSKVARIAVAEYREFDGGLNIRDAPYELEKNETPACANATLDERGGVAPRLGTYLLNGSSLLPAAPCYLYDSRVADALLAYVSTASGAGKLYKSTDGGVTWSAAYSTFTAGALGAIVDFHGRVVVVNTLDGVYSFPSNLGAPTHTSGGSANMEAVKGSCIAIWQDLVIVGGDPNNRARIWASNGGSELLWTIADDYNDLREVDDALITAVGAGQGMDVQSNPTLLVCKNRSCYRVNDSDSLEYTTLSQGAGCGGAMSLASGLGLIAMINESGIWVTDGVQEPQLVSGKLAPLFTRDGVALATTGLWTAAPYRDRFLFSLARAGATSNNLQLEFHPKLGWIVPHKGRAIGPMAVYRKNTERLMGCAATTGRFYELNRGGTDDGTAITVEWQSRWEELNVGAQARLRRLRVWGRGEFDSYVKVDFKDEGDLYPFDFTDETGLVWGSGHWDVDRWEESKIQADTEVALDEVGKFFAVGLRRLVSTSASAPKLLDDGNAPESGVFALYGMRLDYVPLGIS